MMSCVKFSLCIILLYSWQYPENVNDFGTSWNPTTVGNSITGVRISRLLTAKLGMQAPKQTKVLAKPGNGAPKESAPPGNNPGKPGSKVPSEKPMPPSSQDNAPSEKKENKPKGTEVKNATDTQIPEQNKLCPSPSGDSSFETTAPSEKSDPSDCEVMPGGLLLSPQNEAQSEKTEKESDDATLKGETEASQGGEGTAVYSLKTKNYAMRNLILTDWDRFMQSSEHDWAAFQVCLNNARETFLEQKNKEWSNWIHLIEKKKLKKWLDDTYSTLPEIYAKDMEQLKYKKIKGWLMYQWQKNEKDSDHESLELMKASEFLQLAKSREWYRSNLDIDKQREEFMKWFVLKENEYLKKQEQSDWTYWKNVKLIMTDSMCTTLSVKPITKKQWNQLVNEIKM
ncbi:hypothetical protein AK88_02097 [Plasmodium fragile]|uniref:Tryptophan/threonine-rich plasmodium antigen C-terminal domain-containing protein n=1 Tax=Plasmodium fragile TaxID=5857 RepID=A0A0D9QRL1_PLAFR|nr:uncharacterized protein AK88_02097 [Plasmodium fragile]KJP88316.1 hypothetical protein AK88_02097 [Plasmodium fragile]